MRLKINNLDQYTAGRRADPLAVGR